jgi:hypothetical protein
MRKELKYAICSTEQFAGLGFKILFEDVKNKQTNLDHIIKRFNTTGS